jgi:glycosyltransferase involved in cell wall biosynthesis
MGSSKRICLLTPGNVVSNPRIVKEADALHEAGYQVQVISTDLYEPVRARDDALVAQKPWPCKRLRASKFQRIFAGVFARVGKKLLEHGVKSPKVDRWIQGVHGRLLWKEAARHRADLYIARYLPALPAAHRAAQVNGAKYGFDAEDFHMAELHEYPGSTPEIERRRRIETAYLPDATTFTAASPMIAEEYERAYGRKPEVIHNVFPLCEAPATPAAPQADGPPSLYWFSQTTGPGRGLEQMIEIIAAMKTPVRLSLRGHVGDSYRAKLTTLWKQSGAAEKLEFLVPDEAPKMARLAAQHHLGLAIELNEPYHHTVCLANKIFVYLLAGLPVLLSRTPAQEAIARELDDAAILIDLDQPKETAAKLDAYFADPSRQQIAHEAAWNLGQTHWNWDAEKEKFLKLVESAFG